MCAASTDVERTTARPPSGWDPDMPPLQLALQFKFERYSRCCLYSDTCVTSRAWQATKTRDNQWIVFQHHLHEQAQQTSTCVGRVAYFVKATPRSREAAESLRALGLPTEPQRFAIVDAYAATEAQQACQGVDLQTDWAKAAAEALVSAGVLGDKKSFINLLRRVQEHATVLRVGKQSKVTLKRRVQLSGELHRLAIPLSSNYETWYHKHNAEANWAVTPVVRIDPREAKAHMAAHSQQMNRAMDAVRNTLMYFVHTYSMSNSKM